MKYWNFITLLIFYPFAVNAAGDVFFSLKNTNFIVSVAFILFVIILLYLKVPSLIGGLLDKRADGIRSDLEEAKKLRDDAQSILASYERKQQEIGNQAERIIANAKEEAEAAAAQAKEDLQKSIERRIQTAEEQLISTEAAAISEIRETAISVAIEAASTAIKEYSQQSDQEQYLENSIEEIAKKIH
jgi:F-type H+-transporting ATPase subunit b